MQKLNEIGEMLGPPYHDGVVVGLTIKDDYFSVSIKKDQYLIDVNISSVHDFGFFPLCSEEIVSNIRVINKNDWRKLNIESDDPWKILTGGKISDCDYKYIISRLELMEIDLKLIIFDFSSGGGIVVVGVDWSISAR